MQYYMSWYFTSTSLCSFIDVLVSVCFSWSVSFRTIKNFFCTSMSLYVTPLPTTSLMRGRSHPRHYSSTMIIVIVPVLLLVVFRIL